MAQHYTLSTLHSEEQDGKGPHPACQFGHCSSANTIWLMPILNKNIVAKLHCEDRSRWRKHNEMCRNGFPMQEKHDVITRTEKSVVHCCWPCHFFRLNFRSQTPFQDQETLHQKIMSNQLRQHQQTVTRFWQHTFKKNWFEGKHNNEELCDKMLKHYLEIKCN